MKKQIKLLIKCLKRYTNLSTKKSALFLLDVFEKNKIFDLPENKQKILINNLLSYFDTLISGIENKKKKHHLFNNSEILNHIIKKVYNFNEISNFIKVY